MTTAAGIFISKILVALARRVSQHFRSLVESTPAARPPALILRQQGVAQRPPPSEVNARHASVKAMSLELDQYSLRVNGLGGASYCLEMFLTYLCFFLILFLAFQQKDNCGVQCSCIYVLIQAVFATFSLGFWILRLSQVNQHNEPVQQIYLPDCFNPKLFSCTLLSLHFYPNTRNICVHQNLQKVFLIKVIVQSKVFLN